MRFSDDILRDLGFDPDDRFKVGAWFTVPERAVKKSGSASHFADAKAREGKQGRYAKVSKVALSSSRPLA